MLELGQPRLVAMKRLIDDGYAVGLADGLAIEGERARAANTRVKATDVEARRKVSHSNLIRIRENWRDKVMQASGEV